MLNWNDVAKARSHREDLLRESAADRRVEELDRRERSWTQLLAGLVALVAAAEHWLRAS